MGLEQATVSEIVDKAVTHRWGVPEFQRGFVWTPQKVRDLVDSLWRGYRVGAFLIWYGGEYEEPRTAEDGVAPGAWLLTAERYEEFLDTRAPALAEAANGYFQELRTELDEWGNSRVPDL